MDRKNEFLVKLEQIQEQAQLTLEELPLRLAKDRLRLIIGLARYLQTELRLGAERISVSVVDSAERPRAAPPA